MCEREELTILAVRASLVTAIIGQRGRYWARTKAILDVQYTPREGRRVHEQSCA